MKVQVVNDANETIWQRGKETGLTSRAYLTDGTQQEIINALRDALEQAEAELIISDDVDGVLDIGRTTT